MGFCRQYACNLVSRCFLCLNTLEERGRRKERKGLYWIHKRKKSDWLYYFSSYQHNATRWNTHKYNIIHCCNTSIPHIQILKIAKNKLKIDSAGIWKTALFLFFVDLYLLQIVHKTMEKPRIGDAIEYMNEVLNWLISFHV